MDGTPWDVPMQEAMREAEAAAALGDVPVGALVLRDGEVVVRAHNRREVDLDPTAHAEVLALREASRRLGRWRLTGCTLVVTLEPCAMCAYAAVLARVDRVVFGATDPKAGAAGSLHSLLGDPRHNHRPEVVPGVLGPACSTQLKAFFAQRR